MTKQIQIQPTKNFTNLVADNLGKCTMTQLELPMLLIACEWKLRLCKAHDFKVAKRILINSVKYN